MTTLRPYQENKGSGIYKMYWPGQNEYYYIGQAVRLSNRWKGHICGFKKQDHGNDRLQKTFNKYGNPSFIVIEYCERDSLSEREQYYLDLYITDSNCCNISPAVHNKIMAQETKDRIRESRIGMKLSAEHRSSISSGLLEAYKSGRSVVVGKYGSENHFYNKKHTDETKILMKIASKTNKLGAKNGKARLCLNLETGIFYDYVGEAAEAMNIRPGLLRKWVHKKAIGKNGKSSIVYV